jgi:RNA polymerase sigma-70 factor (ECF subfamily)
MINRVDRSVEKLVEEILVMDCQSGSVKALEMLVSRWQKRLWQYAYNLTGNSEAAWDITQESWLAIIKGLRKLHDPANFKAWAYRITTNKSIDWIRKSKAVKKISIEEIQDHQQKEKKDTGVKELLEKLDIRKQAVLSLYYFEQLSVPEISVALKIFGKNNLNKLKEK